MIGIGNLLVAVGTLIAMGVIIIATILFNIGLVIVAAMFVRYIAKLIIKDIKEGLIKTEIIQE